MLLSRKDQTIVWWSTRLQVRELHPVFMKDIAWRWVVSCRQPLPWHVPPASPAPLNLTLTLFIVYLSRFGDHAGTSSNGARGRRARALIVHKAQLQRTLPGRFESSASAQSPLRTEFSSYPLVSLVQHPRSAPRRPTLSSLSSFPPHPPHPSALNSNSGIPIPPS